MKSFTAYCVQRAVSCVQRTACGVRREVSCQPPLRLPAAAGLFAPRWALEFPWYIVSRGLARPESRFAASEDQHAAGEESETVRRTPHAARQKAARRTLGILASALLFLAAFPPLNLGFLVFVALVPWLLNLKDTPRRQAGWGGFLWGFIVVGVQMIWIPSLVRQWTGSATLGYLPLFVCAVIGGGYYAFIAHLMRRALQRNWLWAIPLIWAGFEVFRSYVPGLAFPFFLVATPLWPFPFLIGAAYVGTIYFVGAWVVLINIVIYSLMAQRRRQLRPMIAAAAVILVASFLKSMQPLEGTPTLIAAGQPGVNMAFTQLAERNQQLFGAVEMLNEQAKVWKAKLLILPEGVASSDGAGLPLTPFEVHPDMPVLFGGTRFELAGPIGGATKERNYQSAFTQTKGKWSHVDKARLVVFGEYVPGRDFLPFLDKFNLAAGDLTPSDETRSIKAGGIEVGPMLCFEGLFWDVAHKQSENGAQLLAVMSIDDWYMGTPAPDQLRAGSIWRAVETGLPVVRSAATGYTMGVDQRGRIINELPIGKTEALILRVHIEDNPARMPGRVVFPWLAGLSLPVLAVFLWWRRGKD